MVFLSPVGLAAAPVANRVSLLATYKEELCSEICATSTNQPEALVSYRYERPVLNGTTVFVPIVATVTILIPGCGCQAVPPQVITERFLVAFQGQKAIPTSVTISSEGRQQGIIKVVCGKSSTYAVNDSITVAITPPAAPAA